MPLAHHHGFSIIVPTFKEANNISLLVQRIAQIDVGNQPFEVIIVDDNSQDGTIEIIHQLRTTYSWLKLIVRSTQKGLSASALEGFKQANYPVLILMDADLSHPPEKIPEVLKALAEPDTEMVIGSRYIQGGSSDEQWPFIRKITSHLGAGMARMLLFTKITDPLSGFFAIEKKYCFSGDPLDPIGWKIGLEIMVKRRLKNIKEISIHFTERHHGTSKLNIAVGFSYLLHINKLIFYRIFS